MPNFYEYVPTRDAAALEDTLNYLGQLFAQSERVEVSKNALDGHLRAPSKTHKYYSVPICFSADQFDKAQKTLTLKAINEIEDADNTIICFVFVRKKEVVK
jgi:hypothetical protein